MSDFRESLVSNLAVNKKGSEQSALVRQPTSRRLNIQASPGTSKIVRGWTALKKHLLILKGEKKFFSLLFFAGEAKFYQRESERERTRERAGEKERARDTEK